MSKPWFEENFFSGISIKRIANKCSDVRRMVNILFVQKPGAFEALYGPTHEGCFAHLPHEGVSTCAEADCDSGGVGQTARNTHL